MEQERGGKIERVRRQLAVLSGKIDAAVVKRVRAEIYKILRGVVKELEVFFAKFSDFKQIKIENIKIWANSKSEAAILKFRDTVV